MSDETYSWMISDPRSADGGRIDDGVAGSYRAAMQAGTLAANLTLLAGNVIAAAGPIDRGPPVRWPDGRRTWWTQMTWTAADGSRLRLHVERIG